MSDFLDPVTRRGIERGLEELRVEFRGIFSAQSIERYVAESSQLLKGPQIQTFLPIFVNRLSAPVCESSPKRKEPS